MNKIAVAVVAVVAVVCIVAGAAMVLGNINDDSIAEGVNYHGNGGKTIDGKDVVPASEHIVMSNLFVKDGYKFTGWNTAADGSGTPYAENDNIDYKTREVIDLYAQWSVAGKTITMGTSLGGLEFYYNGKELNDYTSAEIPNTGKITVTINVPEGATDLEYVPETDDDGTLFQMIQYNLDSKLRKHMIVVEFDGEDYAPEYKVIDGHVEMIITCNNANVHISYMSGS